MPGSLSSRAFSYGGPLIGFLNEGTMSNVFQLFRQEKSETQSDLVTTAVRNIFASSAELGRKINELSICFDAADEAIDALVDAEIRTRHKHLMKLNRETLASATLGLSEQIGKLPGATHKTQSGK
jgi:hypothetical protein